MKKIVALFLFFISVLTVSAQQDSTGKPRSVVIQPVAPPVAAAAATPATKPHRKPYPGTVPKDRIVLDLNAANWIRHNDANGFRTRVYSRGLNLYGMYDIQLQKSRVSFAFGFGISFVDIYNNSTLYDSTNGSGAKFTRMPNYPDTVKLNKVAMTYLDIPLELRIRTNRDKLDQVWKFNIGFKAGIRIDAYTRTIYKNPRESERLKPYPDFNLFRMGPTLRIGYSSFNFTAYYGLLDVFKVNRGPEMNEWSFGISFNGL
jgi:hypothetical protein